VRRLARVIQWFINALNTHYISGTDPEYLRYVSASVTDGAAFMRRHISETVDYYRQGNRWLYGRTISLEIIALAIALATAGIAAICYLIWLPL
jgi:hypothetical protein